MQTSHFILGHCPLTIGYWPSRISLCQVSFFSELPLQFGCQEFPAFLSHFTSPSSLPSFARSASILLLPLPDPPELLWTPAWLGVHAIGFPGKSRASNYFIAQILKSSHPWKFGSTWLARWKYPHRCWSAQMLQPKVSRTNHNCPAQMQNCTKILEWFVDYFDSQPSYIIIIIYQLPSYIIIWPPVKEGIPKRWAW